MRLSPLRSYHRTSAVPTASQMTSPAAAATTDRVSPALAIARRGVGTEPGRRPGRPAQRAWHGRSCTGTAVPEATSTRSQRTSRALTEGPQAGNIAATKADGLRSCGRRSAGGLVSWPADTRRGPGGSPPAIGHHRWTPACNILIAPHIGFTAHGATDLYQCHHWDGSAPIEETMATLTPGAPGGGNPAA
jgi:hypothetical protein